jgi:hypothetical protein
MVDDHGAIHAGPVLGTNRFDGRKTETTSKDGQATEKVLFRLRQKPVTPIEGGS